MAYSDRNFAVARSLLCGSGWKITLDRVEDSKNVLDALRDSSGFAITHVGKLERENGTEFTTAEALATLDALGWYLSFCVGRWSGPCLPRGFDAKNKTVWDIWNYFRTAPYRSCSSWVDKNTVGCIEGPFPGFFKLWQDDAWEEVVRVAIHWYVEANAQAGSIEGSIVLTQTAFELLASAVLVENHKWLSNDGYDKLAAADRIRLLFLWAGIPTAIPDELPELKKAAKADNWVDASTAMTMVRNTITHPTKKNREKYGKHTSEMRSEVWMLGLWALELCLLRLFEYYGKYGNRITQTWVGQVETVPWATESK